MTHAPALLNRGPLASAVQGACIFQCQIGVIPRNHIAVCFFAFLIFLRENPIFETSKNDCEQQGENVNVSLMGVMQHMDSARLTAPAGSRQQY